jgi:hypothetical protein
MQISDIIAIITLGFPFVSVIMAILGGLYLLRFQGDISPLVTRLMDSRDFLDAITNYVVNNSVIEKRNEYYIVRVRNEYDTTIPVEN